MTQLCFEQRMCYNYPYVMLASILSADPVDEEDPCGLREAASSDGICYIHILRSFHDGWYLVRVAACPELLPEGYTIVLSEKELAYALPWDCRLRGEHMTPEFICKRLCAYRASYRPMRQQGNPTPQQFSSEANTLESTSRQIAHDAMRVSSTQLTAIEARPLPHVFVSLDDCQQAFETMERLQEVTDAGHRPARCKTCQRYWLERLMVRAVLKVLEKAHSQERSVPQHLFERLQRAVRRVLVSLYRFPQRLVHVSAVCQDLQHIGWLVQIDLPVALAA